MMLRKCKAMKSLNYYGEQLKGSSDETLRASNPQLHTHISIGKLSNVHPEIFAEVFSNHLDEALQKLTIKNNKALMEKSLTPKPVPRRTIKI